MLKRRMEDKERRRYIRLDSVFPVNFQLLSLDEKEAHSEWIQGFTNNISRGGICLFVNNLESRFAEMIKKRQVKLSLNIEMPLHKTPVSAKATVAWVEAVAKETDKYLIGVAYEEISSDLNSRIFRYALAKKFLPRFVMAISVILLLSFSFSSYLNLKLIRSNKALVEQFINILQESSLAKQEIKKLTQEREELGSKLSEMEIQLNTLEEEKQKISEAEKAKLIKEEEAKKKIEDLMGLIEPLEIEKSDLQEKLISLQEKESTITGNLLLLDKKKADLEKANFEKMYQWLKVHQNPRTGLVLSYEGDKELVNWSFLYDQALAAIAYVNFADFERAKKIFEFFKSKAGKTDAGYLNAYYTNDGEPAEYLVHSGPNIWLGIALLQYTKRTQDNTYLDLARAIGDWVVDLQSQDKDGGIRGGPKVYWYSTEHNLDAYALFNMLYKITRETKYIQAAQKTLGWINLHVYDRPDVPIIRGKGDSTIATDTYTWSIASIGPQKLEELGMNPDKIIEFAEETCAVETEYVRPSGEKLKIKGFDFAPVRHLSRGAVISSEWTAQMVLAYKLMARFYYKKDMSVKARFYELKADSYLTQLGKLIISSPSPSGLGEGCLPYASQDSVDTGHGWATPKGKSTGSVAATAYALFAYYGRNPLEFAD